jgi:hypothetical protein
MIAADGVLQERRATLPHRVNAGAVKTSAKRLKRRAPDRHADERLEALKLLRVRRLRRERMLMKRDKVVEHRLKPHGSVRPL